MNKEILSNKVWGVFDTLVAKQTPLHEIRKRTNDMYETVLNAYEEKYHKEIYSEIFAGIDVELVAMWEQESEEE